MGNWSKKKLVTAILILAGVGIVTHEKYKKEQKRNANVHIPYGIYEAVIKRPFDVMIATIALIVFSPVIAVIALLIKVKLGSPILFAQKRPGLNGKIFTIYKFRTMSEKKGADGELLPDIERLTSFGKVLRDTSLDELPELYNILLGDMSVVGPRPLLVEYLSRYNKQQVRRHEVRPGLTGLAQVSGRNSLSWTEKFEDDVKYVDHITFIGDLYIMVKTVFKVLKRDGINADETTTMPRFEGNNY